MLCYNDDETEVKVHINDTHKYTICQDFMSGEHGFSGILFPQSIRLSRFLVSSEHIFDGCTTINDRKCMELGSGCGLVSMVVAKMGAFTPVIATDLPGALEHLKSNISENHCEDSVTTTSLEWGNNDDIQRVRKDFTNDQGFDCVFGTDVFYGVDAVDPLFDTIEALVHTESIVFVCGIVLPPPETPASESTYAAFKKRAVRTFDCFFVQRGSVAVKTDGAVDVIGSGEEEELSDDALCRGVWMLVNKARKNPQQIPLGLKSQPLKTLT